VKVGAGVVSGDPDIKDMDSKTSNLLIFIGIAAGTLVLIALILMMLGFF